MGLALIFMNNCKKDEEEAGDKIIDADGNVYKSVTIGTQTWLIENLRTTKYSNGDPIGTTSSDISNENEPKYQWAPDGNESNVSIYGRLYTWYAASDNRNVCPAGWHVPTDTEWTSLENYLITNGYNYDGTNSENKIAKALASKTGWENSLNAGAPGNTDFPDYRNKSGFTAVPGGFHNPNGQFGYFGKICYYWSSADESNTNGWCHYMIWDNPMIIRSPNTKPWGFSIRCIKN